MEVLVDGVIPATVIKCIPLLGQICPYDLRMLCSKRVVNFNKTIFL